MNPSHVVSLELAKELKEAGFKKETEFWWASGFSDEHIGWLPFGGKFGEAKEKNGLGFKPLVMEYPEKPVFKLLTVDDRYYNRYGEPNKRIEFYSAPLATEVLEDLPEHIEDKGFLKIYKLANSYDISYGNIYPKNDNSLCDALAKCWLYLRKEKLI